MKGYPMRRNRQDINRFRRNLSNYRRFIDTQLPLEG
jgi:hypothetical protein